MTALKSIGLLFATLTLWTIVGHSAEAGNVCDKAELWCQNEIIARECKVLRYCKVVWSMKYGLNKPLTKLVVPEKQDVKNAQPVKVSLYFESLCPGCRQFILTQMYPTFNTLAQSGILEVELVPFGNAREIPYGSSYYFYCQHGPTECVGNMIETCAIHVIGNAEKYMEFIKCVETYQPTDTNARYCASIQKIDYAPIASCVSSSQGVQLQHEMAVKTASLNPPHQFVPWITVNGYHTDQIQNAVTENMLQYVCNTYKGTRPAVCGSTNFPDVGSKKE